MIILVFVKITSFVKLLFIYTRNTIESLF